MLARLRYERETGVLVTKVASERERLEIAIHHVRILDAMPGRLAVKLANQPLADCKRILRAFADEAKRKTYGELPDEQRPS